MLIFALDDEMILLMAAEKAIKTAAPDAEVMAFSNPQEALDTVKLRDLKPEIVFTDIEMPGMTGLEFAVKLKTLSPQTRVVFVTAYVKYAYDAFKVRAHGFILKPLEPGDVLEELNQLPRVSAPQTDKLRIQCFGFFEVFWEGKPLSFSRSKTKELLAYLVDRNGAYCTAGEIINMLWEEKEDGRKAKSYLRVLTSDLTATLSSIGQQEVLLKKRGQLAVDVTKLDCDYYNMLHGDVDALNTFYGSYMTQYSWAEMTLGSLVFRQQDQDGDM